MPIIARVRLEPTHFFYRYYACYGEAQEGDDYATKADDEGSSIDHIWVDFSKALYTSFMW